MSNENSFPVSSYVIIRNVDLNILGSQTQFVAQYALLQLVGIVLLMGDCEVVLLLGMLRLGVGVVVEDVLV